MEPLTLTEEEIIEATGYRRPSRQIEVLLKAGIPAERRPDGTVRVWRHHIPGTREHANRREPQVR
jgi:hypothetical protein